jgi:hypothetical protein
MDLARVRATELAAKEADEWGSSGNPLLQVV